MMKRILITGTNSYIGTSFTNWVLQNPDKYTVDNVSLRNEQWRDGSFEGYDTILHAAAIVHIQENDIQKYLAVNRDLTLNVAQKAKQEGVKQFIFLSTMGVYGVETGYITESTVPAPKTLYAQSKYEAEQLIQELNDDTFKVAIIRPPLVYGRLCKGNYSRLVSMALRLPVFPNIENERSMIFIDHLSEFIRILIDAGSSGMYFPQNKEYVQTVKLVECVLNTHNKELRLTNKFNWVISFGLGLSSTFRKVFGTFVYDKTMPGGPSALMNGKEINYQTMSFEQSVRHTESRDLAK